ncbi:MAG TPA: LytTR family DNA-binding domain-containing protein [Candidatus Acidoferrum sp.]|nr:LytTR family DNA-binding domain-containing protein [Candidatus Acidoferrum sp.]
MPLTTLIVDDEPLAREGLRALLSRDSEVSAIHEARDGSEAVASIRESKPDLVFLDVQMPEMDGFAVIREIGAEEMPAVVFVTAHDRYAIQAFEINALDYLLKPVTEERFGKALMRAKGRIHSNLVADSNRQIIRLLETIALPRSYPKRLAIRSAGKTLFVDVKDVDWIEAAENYVELHVGSVNYLLHVTMNSLEKSLDPEIFLRIHRSIIVNLGRIKNVQSAAHGEHVVTLRDGVRLQSGRTYSERLRALVNNPF